MRTLAIRPSPPRPCRAGPPFGDFGTGAPSQIAAAAAIRRAHAARPFDFGITMGDNFYSEGLRTPTDPRWTTQWEALYGSMGVPFYATLGNHDWYDPDSPAAEILRTRESRSWRMPASYYTFTAGPAQFFALDTFGWSERQARWLREALDASRATWKIVYGHHPPYVSTPGANPAYNEEVERWARQLMPILAGSSSSSSSSSGHRADLFLAGHHHSMQQLVPPEGVPIVIAGGGGAATYPVGRAHPEVLFADAAHGFAVLEIAARTLTIRLVSADRGERYVYTLRKPSAGDVR